MTDREKKIELIKGALEHASKQCEELDSCCACPHGERGGCQSAFILDYLIANGVAFAKDADVPSKWISVEDSMPEPMAWVLCACRANIIEVLRYDRNIDGWGTAGPNRGYMKSFVTHWMPLPEPPGGDAE